MGNVDKGDPDALLYGAQLRAHVLSQLQVQSGQGLVEQQHLRLGCQRAGDGHALLLTTRKLVTHFVTLARECDQLQELIGAFTPLRFTNPLDLEREGDVLPHGHQREQGEILENQGGGTFVGTNTGHVLATDTHLSLGWLEKPRNRAQKRCLTASGGPRKLKNLPPSMVMFMSRAATKSPNLIQTASSSTSALIACHPDQSRYMSPTGSGLPSARHAGATPQRVAYSSVDAV